MFDRGAVHIIVAGYIVGHFCFNVKQRSGSYCGGGVVLTILLTITFQV